MACENHFPFSFIQFSHSRPPRQCCICYDWMDDIEIEDVNECLIELKASWTTKVSELPDLTLLPSLLVRMVICCFWFTVIRGLVPASENLNGDYVLISSQMWI